MQQEDEMREIAREVGVFARAPSSSTHPLRTQLIESLVRS